MGLGVCGREREPYLFVEVKEKDNDGEEEGGEEDGERYPGDPCSWPQVELAAPGADCCYRAVAAAVVVVSAGRWRVDDDFGIWDDALHVDEVAGGVEAGCVEGRADEEVLDVVVRASQSEVGIRGEERLVRCLG